MNKEIPAQIKTVTPIMVNDNDLNEETQPEMQEQPSYTEPSSSSSNSFFKNLITGLKSFFTSGIFWKNLAAIMALAFFLLFAIIGILNLYTHHGKYYVVENYVDLDFGDAKKRT